MRKLADSVGIERVNTSKGLFSYGFLIVGEEQSTELLSLEEVFSVVLSLGHRKNILVRIALIHAT